MTTLTTVQIAKIVAHINGTAYSTSKDKTFQIGKFFKACETIGISENDAEELLSMSFDDVIAAIDAHRAPKPVVEDVVSVGGRIPVEPVSDDDWSEVPSAKSKTVRTPKTTRRADGLREGSKAAIMIDMVMSPGGATEPEICAAIGWEVCATALKRNAKKAGITLSLVKSENGRGRYVGSRAA